MISKIKLKVQKKYVRYASMLLFVQKRKNMVCKFSHIFINFVWKNAQEPDNSICHQGQDLDGSGTGMGDTTIHFVPLVPFYFEPCECIIYQKTHSTIKLYDVIKRVQLYFSLFMLILNWLKIKSLVNLCSFLIKAPKERNNFLLEN